MSLFVEGKLFNIANAESGGGSGDQHNLGWYATESALTTAHPTAKAGDYAIVGSTDTVWIWDTDNSEWTDSGAKSPTYTAGTGISIDTNNEISVTDPVLMNTATGTGSVVIMGSSTNSNCVVVGAVAQTGGSGSAQVAIGHGSSATGNGATVIGQGASASGLESIAIGQGATANANGAVQIKYGTNSTANTLQFKSYQVVSADGTIPTARLTKVNTTITLTAAGWSNGSQTVSVSGITSTGVVFVSPDPTDQTDYTTAGIICTAQATDSLTFTATTTPSNDIDVVVVML